MSSVAIITSIIVLLVGLVCYAFITQTLSQKRQQRERLLLALKSRVRNFKFMLSGFPPGFLPKELALLVQRSLLQLLEQLSRLEPGNKDYGDDIQTITQQMAETQHQPPLNSHPPAMLESPQKAREIKACLEELYKFIFHLESKKSLAKVPADAYRGMIRHLVLQLSVDSYVLQGRIARDRGKLRLAIHYFDLALKLMTKERTNEQFDGRIKQMRAAIKDLEGRLLNDSSGTLDTAEEETDQSPINSEWDNFAQDESWKKKQLYD
jgi:hypothetical protein